MFLENIGCIISFIIILLIIYPIIFAFSLKFELFKKIRGYFEWNGFFMIILFNYYGILHAAFVQLKQVTIEYFYCDREILVLAHILS
jgi:hypothetical protein